MDSPDLFLPAVTKVMGVYRDGELWSLSEHLGSRLFHQTLDGNDLFNKENLLPAAVMRFQVALAVLFLKLTL